MSTRRAARVALLILIFVAACSADRAAQHSGRDGGAGDARTHDARGAAIPDVATLLDASSDDATSADGDPVGDGASDDGTPPSDVHLHHVHMNVTDVERTRAFYETFFGTQSTELDGQANALTAGPALLILEERETKPSSALVTALQHVGWGSSDVVAWFENAEGIVSDTRGQTLFVTGTEPTVVGPGALLSGVLGGDPPACFEMAEALAYIYVTGPDDERIEVWSGADQRVNHTHFTAANVRSTVEWYRTLLGVDVIVPPALANSAAFFIDDILFFFEELGDGTGHAPTDDHVLGHLAFSVANLGAWRQRVEERGIEIVREPGETYGFTSFFVRGPDGMLLEFVEVSEENGCSDR